jgi:hypothetical protein
MKNLIVIFIIMVAIAIIGLGGYLLGNRGSIKLSYLPASSSPSASSIPSPTATPVADETEMIKAAVKLGLIDEHGPNAANMVVTVSKIDGASASGGAIEPGSVGGGMWLATKVNGNWELIWDGNGTISCQIIAPYNFPISMVPECWDENTLKSVTR